MFTQLNCYPVQTGDFLPPVGSAARRHSWLREEPEDLIDGGLPSCCLPLTLAQPHLLLSGAHLTVQTTKEETEIHVFSEFSNIKSTNILTGDTSYWLFT